MQCPYCKKEVSPQAENCPFCGQPIKKKTGPITIAVTVILLVFIAWFLWNALGTAVLFSFLFSLLS